MADVVCAGCHAKFDPTNHLATGGGVLAGAAAGAYVGSGIGLAGGPLGAMAGTIPGAVVGGLLAGLGVSKFAKCPRCGKVMTL